MQKIVGFSVFWVLWPNFGATEIQPKVEWIWDFGVHFSWHVVVHYQFGWVHPGLNLGSSHF